MLKYLSGLSFLVDWKPCKVMIATVRICTQLGCRNPIEVNMILALQPGKIATPKVLMLLYISSQVWQSTYSSQFAVPPALISFFQVHSKTWNGLLWNIWAFLYIRRQQNIWKHWMLQLLNLCTLVFKKQNSRHCINQFIWIAHSDGLLQLPYCTTKCAITTV